MAEAVDDTIPCEHCNNPIEMDDWMLHTRQCTNKQKRQKNNIERSTTAESTTNDGIPCEYCSEVISLDGWESHSKECADAHKRRIENLKNGIDDEPEDANIPCEYCNKSISIYDWEWHSAQCTARNRPSPSIPLNNTTNSTEPLIPCEYCNIPISIHDITWHTRQCADMEKQRLDSLARQFVNEENHNLIPCEYCTKTFALELIEDHQVACRREHLASEFQLSGSAEPVVTGLFPAPDHWNRSSPYNLSRYTLDVNSDEYNFVEQKFHKSLPNNQIVQIERIQNRRWYRQYEAHRDYFIERYGKSTEQWLFHGFKGQSVDAIINDCFNRSHAVRFAAGQGIYFATEASISLSYTQPDEDHVRHMFLARVLVGKTTHGDASTRVCPKGFDTTGGGNVFVTYHDAQAYGEYLITFR